MRVTREWTSTCCFRQLALFSLKNLSPWNLKDHSKCHRFLNHTDCHFLSSGTFSSSFTLFLKFNTRRWCCCCCYFTSLLAIDAVTHRITFIHFIYLSYFPLSPHLKIFGQHRALHLFNSLPSSIVKFVAWNYFVAFLVIGVVSHRDLLSQLRDTFPKPRRASMRTLVQGQAEFWKSPIISWGNDKWCL